MQTVEQTTQDEAVLLRRSVARLARRLRSERRDGSMSPNKLIVLGRLHATGPLTPGEIATVERQRPQSLTRTFAELQSDGLISRERSARDGRESMLAITRAGRDALIADMAERDAWLAGAIESLTETERSLLAIVAPVLDRLASS